MYFILKICISTVVVFHSWFQFDLDSFGLRCLLEDDRGAKSLIFSHLQTNGSSTGNGKRVSSQFGTLFRLFKLLLGLAILGQVEGSDFLCFLNLLLVGLDLLLEFPGQFRHAVLVLVVFIQLELELLDAALSLLESLEGIRSLALTTAEFNFQFPDAGFKFGHGSTSTLGSNIIGLGQTLIKFSNLRFKRAFGLLLLSRVLLFSSKFIGKTGGINHSLLGFLLRVLSLGKHIINFSMHGVDGRFKTSLVRSGLGVDGGHVIDSSPSISQFHISLFLAAVSRIKKSTSFLKLTLKSIGTTISQTSLLSNLTTLTSFLLIKTLNITKLSLVPLDGLVSLSVSLVGMIKSNFKFIDIRLKLLLDAKSLSLGSRLCLQRSLQGVHSAHVVFPGVFKLLLLLLDLAINFLANLSKFQLSPQDLVLLLLKSSLSFFKCSLELFLLNLKTTSLFVKLMNRTSSISKLVKEILDLISKILVLPL